MYFCLQKDFWRLRANSRLGIDPCEEELYIDNQLVVWSRGTTDNARKIIKSFTADSAVHEVSSVCVCACVCVHVCVC